MPADPMLEAIAALRVERRRFRGADLLSYPDAPETVVDVLDLAVHRFPDRPFLEADEGTFTYREVADLVEGAAADLAARGVGRGGVVAVAALNGVDIAVAVLACARLGAVMAGLNTKLAAARWADVLAHTGAGLVLAQPRFRDDAAAAAEVAGLRPTAVVPIADVARAGPRPWAYDPARERPDPAATYALVFTSGTTGRPKASRVVHRASCHSAFSYAHVTGVGPQSRTAVLFQLHYISALHAHVLPMALVGGTAVLVSEATVSEFVRLLGERRITWAYAVPSVWQIALRQEGLDRAHLPELEVAAFGGSPFPTTAMAELRERLPGVRWLDIYGLSETHSPACMLLDHEWATKAGSVGRPLPCMEADVVDPDTQARLPVGAPGELRLRGSLVTTGYEGDDAATAAAISAEGWFRTGDLARIDGDGYVTILDRLKDMIQRGGQKVFSAEVEQLLRAHPAIEDAAVVGAPDALAFEVVVAFVVVRDGHELTRADVRHWVREGMAEHATPRQVHLVDELPRNPTGKLDKVALRAAAAAAARQRSATPGPGGGTEPTQA